MEASHRVTNIANFVENRMKRTYNLDCVDTPPKVISEPQIPPEDISNSETYSDSDSEEIMNQFVLAMDNFMAKVVTSYQNTLQNKLQKFSKQNEKTLQKSLFSIGKKIRKQKAGGRKRKTGKLIPIQVSAKSRRDYKHRGRVVGTSGRRPNDQNRRVQMVMKRRICIILYQNRKKVNISKFIL